MAEPDTSEYNHYLQVHGLDIKEPATLEAALRQAIQRLPTGLYTESAAGLSEGEIALLRAGGLNPETEAGPDPLTATTIEFAALIQTSLDTAEAATRLGVHVSRVRQMLTAGTLYGFQVDGQWRIPPLQFTETGLAPQLGSVLAALDRTLHPVAVCRWLRLPNPDLEVDGKALGPIAWLSAGYDPEPVRRLAADL